jgi:oligogalacturonide lyase
MDAGRIWKSETQTEEDPVTGLPVRRLTGHLGHSHHLYFTNPGWYDGGKRLVFGSDRNNRTNLFSIELASGQITQLTSFPEAKDYTQRLSLLFCSVNPTRPEAYFWLGRELIALNLKTFHFQPIYHAPEGFSVNITNVSADGKYVLTGLYEDLSHKFKVNLLYGYVGFAEYNAAKPLSQIVEIDTHGAGSKVLFEENYWIGHVNTSPTQPHLLSYCHEGPWAKVDNRMWCLDRNTGKTWKVRPTNPGERIGHEYWLADGIHLGYHGVLDKLHVYGVIKYDNTDQFETEFPKNSMHFHSNTTDLIVGDGARDDAHVYLWRKQDGKLSQPRVLCKHRCSAHIQQTHVHPRFSPDGKYVLFTSDHLGYGNLYTVDVPAFESLKESSQ